MSFPARLVSDNSRSLETFERGQCPPAQPRYTLKKTIVQGDPNSCSRIYPVRHVWSSCIVIDPLTSEIQTYDVPKLTGPRTLIRGRRSAQTLQTSMSIVKPTARATIPANNCRSTDISSRCITPLLAYSLPSDIQASQSSVNISFCQSFLDIIVWSNYAFVVYRYFSHAKNYDWHWHWGIISY